MFVIILFIIVKHDLNQPALFHTTSGLVESD